MLLMSLMVVAWFGIAPGGTVAQAAPAPRLVTAAWLAEHMNDSDLVLLHVGGARDYATHIPGARLVTLADIAVSDTSETGLNLQMLPADQLRVKLEGLGISDASRIVIYPGTNAVQAATRVMLRGLPAFQLHKPRLPFSTGPVTNSQAKRMASALK